MGKTISDPPNLSKFDQTCSTPERLAIFEYCIIKCLYSVYRVADKIFPQVVTPNNIGCQRKPVLFGDTILLFFISHPVYHRFKELNF